MAFQSAFGRPPGSQPAPSPGRGTAEQRTARSEHELNAQLQELAGELVVYCCAPTGGSVNDQRVYSGKLLQTAEGYKVISSPTYGTRFTEFDAAETTYNIPHAGYVYQWVHSAKDWLEKKAEDHMSAMHKAGWSYSNGVRSQVPMPAAPSAFRVAPGTQQVQAGTLSAAALLASQRAAAEARDLSPPPRAPNRATGAGPRGNAPQVTMALPSYLQDVGDDEDEDGAALPGLGFLTADVALEPGQWPMFLHAESDCGRLDDFVRNFFAEALPPTKRKEQAPIAEDSRQMLSHLARAMVGASPQAIPFIAQAARIAIKRLYVIKMAEQGQSLAYVRAFAAAADHGTDPAFIRAARTTAANSVKYHGEFQRGGRTNNFTHGKTDGKKGGK